MSSSFAAFTLAVLVWNTGAARVIEVVPIKQVSPIFQGIGPCLDDLKQKITSREASAAHVVADAVKSSIHFANDTLIAPRSVIRCLRVPVSADVLDALEE
jgi:hypothetical protein